MVRKREEVTVSCVIRMSLQDLIEKLARRADLSSILEYDFTYELVRFIIRTISNKSLEVFSKITSKEWELYQYLVEGGKEISAIAVLNSNPRLAELCREGCIAQALETGNFFDPFDFIEASYDPNLPYPQFETLYNEVILTFQNLVLEALNTRKNIELIKAKKEKAARTTRERRIKELKQLIPEFKELGIKIE